MSTHRVLLLLILLVGVGGTRADEAAAWAALRHGGAVALMRHADAPGGVGDPPGFRLDDCSTQRNLSAQGREDAKAAGRRWKAQKVVVGRLLSSPWCRCVDSARLMDLGTPRLEPAFGNVVVWSDRRDALTAGARRLIAAWQGPGNLLVVTHGANIAALTGINPMSSEALVLTVQPDGSLREHGRIAAP
jgi:broad specificity phosphatase PhoE